MPPSTPLKLAQQFNISGVYKLDFPNKLMERPAKVDTSLINGAFKALFERSLLCTIVAGIDLSGSVQVFIYRLIDRPLCPTMFNGFYHGTHILSWVVTPFISPL
ncbi:hypothetical protein DVH24_008932 [Malus domestica]|uniref:Uncharacterized protein n=1 Tax=Malus domestica TaxID=3750 RepID=A0A498JL20_MALDO|nr:hypothetical protein DVH24_008932 [Malus domestica]